VADDHGRWPGKSRSRSAAAHLAPRFTAVRPRESRSLRRAGIKGRGDSPGAR
jgi:hypothetical protein